MEYEMEESGSSKRFLGTKLPIIDSPHFGLVLTEAAHPGILLGALAA
jgi:hypothetical protein